MKMTEVWKRARALGIKVTGLKKVELIRTIQTVEGNIPCFSTGRVECREKDCCWRDDCLVKK